MSDIKIQFNKNFKQAFQGANVSVCNKETAEKARAFHRSFSMYKQTPLVQLSNLAKELNLGDIFVKDESHRFGLNAFKVLGVSYALGEILAKKLGKQIDEGVLFTLSSKETKDIVGEITFASTTDGNHGRGLAWAAEQFGQKAIIYMPKNSDPIRRDNIRSHQAFCEISELNYDDCVEMSWDLAQKNGWITVQDTAWEGYTEVPIAIMQGYSTLCLEILEQMEKIAVERPSHIFLQAGVGCFAGAVLSFFMSVFGENSPTFVIVEPEAANCYYVSAKKGDGNAHTVDGDLATLMAGLACGKPNLTSYQMLLDYSTAFVSCPDFIASRGMRILGNPMGNDQKIISGESGAVTIGLLHWLMTDSEAVQTRKQLGLDNNSKVLCISTEGDTSPKTYKEVVWLGREKLSTLTSST